MGRVVDTVDAEAWCTEHDIAAEVDGVSKLMFQEVSAKNGDHIKDAMKLLVDAVLDQDAREEREAAKLAEVRNKEGASSQSFCSKCCNACCSWFTTGSACNPEADDATMLESSSPRASDATY